MSRTGAVFMFSGYIARRRLRISPVGSKPSGDQRVSPLRLTPAGSSALHEAEAAMLARLDAVLAHTGDAPEAVAALNRLGAGLDALAAERRRG